MGNTIMRILLVALLLLSARSLSSQTMGLITYDPAYADGYVLFDPIASTNTYLIDRCGREVHVWSSSYQAGFTASFQPDGTLLRAANTQNLLYNAGGRGGRIERFDWDGNVVWSFDLSNDTACQHHDFTVLPNGNILLTAWERLDSATVVANGKDPAATNAWLWSEQVLEIQPSGESGAEIVWRWRAWDHLIQDFDPDLPDHGTVSEHPELLDINFFQGPPNSADWIHLNGVSYNAELDQVLLSAHSFDEIWVIDHSTTTAQAATHSGGNSGSGGDLLYRWGNPRAHGRGTVNDQRLFGQHNATWLPDGHPEAGKILVFNNGNGRPGDDYSSVDMIDQPVGSDGSYALVPGQPFGPSDATELYTATPPSDFYSMAIGGAAALHEGYLVSDGMGGRFFEVNADGDIVWQYINPVNQTGPLTQGDPPDNNQVFRCAYYSADFAGFDGHALVPGDEIEVDPLEPSLCAMADVPVTDAVPAVRIHPNPATDRIFLDQIPMGIAAAHVIDPLGRSIQAVMVNGSDVVEVDLSAVTPGVLLVELLDRHGITLHRLRALKL
jgi:hypothetical protein